MAQPRFGDDVNVHISDALIIEVLNGPDGAMTRWSNATARRIAYRAKVLTPKNKVDNARHRNSVVGVMKRSWQWTEASVGHHVSATVYNTAEHSPWVEFDTPERVGGRRQRFSWTSWQHQPRGSIGVVKRTGARRGKHILRDATNEVMPTRCSGYTGLP